MRTANFTLSAGAKKWAAGLPRPKFREETPRRRTVGSQPAIVTAPHNLVRRAEKSSFFSKRIGMVGKSRTDQSFRTHSTTGRCATHKDGSLTVGESPDPPPNLDLEAAVFLDVDGTLLEIAPRPELVQVPPGLPGLIARAAEERQ